MKITFEDTSIFTQIDGDDFYIIIDDTRIGRGISMAIDPAGEFTSVVDDRVKVKLTREVDNQLVQLVDIFAEIRRSAPRLIQLSFIDAE